MTKREKVIAIFVGLLCGILAICCHKSEAATDTFAVHWTNIIASTPEGVYRFANCDASRWRFSNGLADSELLTTCATLIITPPVSGHATNGRAPIMRTRITTFNFDRTDCQFVDQYMISPSVAMELECGWSYGVEFENGFDQ